MVQKVLILCGVALLVAACSGKDPESPEEYYDVASGHMRDGAYPIAIEHYRDLLDQHPFSALAEEAELKIAHAHFQNRACPEAIAAFSDFQRRHPTSPYLPMVGYLIGLCNERQMQKPDRDQSASQSAHAYYQAVINQYPESPFADLAEERLLHCRESLAQHELIVAAYYDKMGNHKAAEVRLVDLVRRYNDTDQAAEGLYSLGAIYEEVEEADKAELAYAALIFHHADHNLADSAADRIEDIGDTENPPVGDPLAALLSRAGRDRNLDQNLPEPRQASDRANTGGGRVGFNQPPIDPSVGSSLPSRRY